MMSSLKEFIYIQLFVIQTLKICFAIGNYFKQSIIVLWDLYNSSDLSNVPSKAFNEIGEIMYGPLSSKFRWHGINANYQNTLTCKV